MAESLNPNSDKKMEEQPATPNPNHSVFTNEGTILSNAPQHSDSSIKNPETSEISTVDDRENSLEFSDELMDKANLAFKEADFPEATELFSRALEIRVAHHGELAPECIKLYYRFGLALLNKAQEEADPLGTMPKKDAESRNGSVKVESAKINLESESSIASVSSKAESASSSQQQATIDVPSKDEEDDDESDTDEPCGAEEDESDLDLAWKMLDLARAISEKHSSETVDMVDILSALAEVSLEREDIETSLSDYQKALSILESVIEPDDRRVAELYPFSFAEFGKL